MTMQARRDGDTVWIDGKAYSTAKLHRQAQREEWRRMHIWLPLARLLDKLPGACWAELVLWAYYHPTDRHQLAKALRHGHECKHECGGCYCGKYHQEEAS